MNSEYFSIFKPIPLYTSTGTSTCMGTTSITITDEAYDYLKSIKGNRSFSQTILALSRSTEDIIRFAGVLRNADWKSIEGVRNDINKEWAHRR